MPAAMSPCGASGQQFGLEHTLCQALGTITHFQDFGNVDLKKKADQ